MLNVSTQKSQNDVMGRVKVVDYSFISNFSNL